MLLLPSQLAPEQSCLREEGSDHSCAVTSLACIARGVALSLSAHSLYHNHALPICWRMVLSSAFLLPTAAYTRMPVWLRLSSGQISSGSFFQLTKHWQAWSSLQPLLAGLQLSQKPLTTFPDVVVVRLSTPSVQSDSEITILRHLEKLGCRLINRPQSILNCINKFWTFQELAGHGVPMPDTFSYGESPQARHSFPKHWCVFFPAPPLPAPQASLCLRLLFPVNLPAYL